MRYIVGVDFDNTLVSYDDVMYKAALNFGWIDPQVKKNKKDIRNKIRELPEGETKWRKLQAFVYGEAMDDAVLIDGVKQFFRSCKNAKTQTYIISHKTEFAAADEQRIDLRGVALNWMYGHGFFDKEGLGLSLDRVYFESTRGEKIERIKNIGCTHFIDDLEETFLEPTFPVNIEKILFAPNSENSFSDETKVLNNWEGISGYFFSAKN